MAGIVCPDSILKSISASIPASTSIAIPPFAYRPDAGGIRRHVPHGAQTFALSSTWTDLIGALLRFTHKSPNNSGIIHFSRHTLRCGFKHLPWRNVIATLDPTQLNIWLGHCALGNQKSFEALYKDVSPQLYSVALRSLRRADWAEEILQESFVRIWHNAGRYDSTLSAPMTWMTNITRNLAIDFLRRKREEQLPESDYGNQADEPADHAPGPLDQLTISQDNKELTRCLDTLDGNQRQSIAITYFQGLSNTEVATQMQQPLGSIKSWIRRGMERLRNCLES